MKPLNIFYKSILVLFLMAFGLQAIAQTSYEERIRLQQLENIEITKFIDQHMERPLPPKEMAKFEASMHHDHDHDNETNRPHVVNEAQELVFYKMLYWRIKYFDQNPAAKALFGAPVAYICDNGDFEDGDFGNYAGEEAHGSTNGHTSGEQTAIPGGITFAPITLDPSSDPDNFMITNVGLDPVVNQYGETLQMVFNGNHAARINAPKPLADPFPNYTSCRPHYGVNKLTKEVVLTAGEEDIAFYFALVLENPTNHDNQQPFFLARALDTDGNEIDRTWRISNAGSPFFEFLGDDAIGGCGTDTTLYSDWFCDYLEVDGYDSVTVEFIISDCGAGGHFGYGYIDDICTSCGPLDTCNTGGLLELNPTEPCIDLPATICGTYVPPAVNCIIGTVDSIIVTVLHDGNDVTVGGGIPATVNADGTFCFTIHEGDLPAGVDSFDFQAIGYFDVGGAPTQLVDVNTNPGENNDLFLECCPEICIECCALYGPCLCEDIDDNTLIYVWATDCEGNVYNAGDNIINWSNGDQSTITTTYMFEEISVEVIDGIDSCVLVDTFEFMCCDSPWIEIQHYCPTDPCTNPSTPFVLNLIDTYSGDFITNEVPYVFLWSDGSTEHYLNDVFVNTEYWVEVWDTATGCYWTDTFIHCCDTIEFELVHCFSGEDDGAQFAGPSFAGPQATSSVMQAISESRVKDMVRNSYPDFTNSEITNMINAQKDCSPCDLDSVLVWVIDPITGLPIGYGGNYTFLWSDGSTSDVNFVEPNECITVTVTDTTSCADPWVGEICIECCTNQTPVHTGVYFSAGINGGWYAQLNWDPVPNAIGYIITIYPNDPNCCNPKTPGQPYSVQSASNSRTISVTGLCCFSWQVQARCDEGLGQTSSWECVNNMPFNCKKVIGPVELSPTKSLEINQGTPISIEEESLFIGINAIPNPAREMVRISVENGEILHGNIEILSISGKIVYQAPIGENHNVRVDVSEFPRGMYFYRYVHQNYVSPAKKLVIE